VIRAGVSGFGAKKTTDSSSVSIREEGDVLSRIVDKRDGAQDELEAS
jgi:hypothetical protein